MIKLDLHTHSQASADGGITAAQYRRVLETGRLDCIAVTDHNTADFALKLHRELGAAIIVGEEIMTTGGEIIGLFLSKTIPGGQSPADTVRAIRQQGGLVYIPHPFETVRSGLSAETLETIADKVDIVEVHNGRAWLQNRGPQALTWATVHRKARAAASDSHGYRALGTTFTEIGQLPTASNLVELLSSARLRTDRPPLYSLLYPKYNRLRKLIVKA